MSDSAARCSGVLPSRSTASMYAPASRSSSSAQPGGTDPTREWCRSRVCVVTQPVCDRKRMTRPNSSKEKGPMRDASLALCICICLTTIDDHPYDDATKNKEPNRRRGRKGQVLPILPLHAAQWRDVRPMESGRSGSTPRPPGPGGWATDIAHPNRK